MRTAPRRTVIPLLLVLLAAYAIPVQRIPHTYPFSQYRVDEEVVPEPTLDQLIDDPTSVGLGRTSPKVAPSASVSDVHSSIFGKWLEFEPRMNRASTADEMTNAYRSIFGVRQISNDMLAADALVTAAETSESGTLISATSVLTLPHSHTSLTLSLRNRTGLSDCCCFILALYS